MDIVVGIIVGLLTLMMLVVLHEFGHFVVARKNGVHVLEFGIGFPPRAVAWIRKNGKWKHLKKSEWEKLKANPPTFENRKKTKIIEDGLIFSLNFLPIGGFCQMDGESAEDSRVGTFGHASFWKKTKILFAGVAMNWLTAFVILTVLAWTGMPEFLEHQFTIESDARKVLAPVEIVSVAEGSPAEEAGLQAGDHILTLDGYEVWSAGEITDYNEAHAGEKVTYEILRGDCKDNVARTHGDDALNNSAKTSEAQNEATADAEANCLADKSLKLTASLNPKDADYLLGITMSTTPSRTYSTWSAPLIGAGLTLQMTGETYKGLAQMIYDLVSGTFRQLSPSAKVREAGRATLSEVKDSVSGPVGIIGTLFPAFTSSGPTNLAFLAALISISLACMNVLPIPALDGGRWFLILFYKLRHEKLTKAIEEKIVARAFVFLFGLMIIVTILDIIRLF